MSMCQRKLTHCFGSIANVPPFLGVWWFPDGYGFKQWTGNDSKALMKVHSKLFLQFLQISICLGIPVSDSRPCTIATDPYLLCILGILLYFLENRHYRDQFIYTGGCSFTFLCKLQNYHYFWHLRGIFVTEATFSHPLSPPYLAFWGTKWNQFINHQVPTYLCSQGALAAVKSTWSTWSDTYHEPKTWPVSCCSFQLCNMGHAWWLCLRLLSAS